MKRGLIIIVLLAVIVISIGAYFLFNKPEPSLTKGQLCMHTGGTVRTSLCCGQTSDFPNLCSIGACGCSPTNSHNVQICDCGAGKCFGNNGCVPLQ